MDSQKAICKHLDNSFLYYLEYTRDYQNNFTNNIHAQICQAWITKLCSVPTKSVEEKRNRNLYLSQLVICIQEGILSKYFQSTPEPGPFVPYPNPPPVNVKLPDWLEYIECEDSGEKTRNGRTYLATKALDDGRGAMAYFSVMINEAEDELISKSMPNPFEEELEKDYEYVMGDINEPNVATILASRKNVEQRSGILSFYNGLLKNIEYQLMGRLKEGCSDAVNTLMTRLIEGLMNEGKYKEYKRLPVRERYHKLLSSLHYKIKMRADRVERRTLLLDEVEQKLISNSLLSETIDIKDKFDGLDWSNRISVKVDSSELFKLLYSYPPELLEAFESLLMKEKCSLGDRAKLQHNNMISQLRRELRKGKEAASAKCDILNYEIMELKGALDACNQDTQSVNKPGINQLQKDIAEAEFVLGQVCRENRALNYEMNKIATSLGISSLNESKL